MTILESAAGATTPGGDTPAHGVTSTRDAQRPTSLRRRLVAVDATILAAVWGPVLLLLGGAGLRGVAPTVAAITAALLTARAHGLYTTWINSMRVVVMDRLTRVAGLSAFGAWVAILWLDVSTVGIGPLIVGAVASFALLALGRNVFDRWLGVRRAEGQHCRSVLLVGGGSDVADLKSFLDDHAELGFRSIGWVGPDTGDAPDGRMGDAADALEHIARSEGTGAMILSSGLDRHVVNDVTRQLVEQGIHVHVWSGLAGINYRRLVTVPVGHEPFLHVAPVTVSRSELAAKRVLDVVVSLAILVVALPVMAIAALAIKAHDGGPVLFRQTRVGKDGQPITVHKLRTMVVDAEDQLIDLTDQNERSGPLFKLAADPRVTRIGEVLRTSSIDELPQLFDVLRGDLSLVGPRPALPAEVAQFDEQLLGRQTVRPGITGLWQVEARDKASFSAYRRLDLFYVENWTLTLDLVILLDSIPAVLGRAIPALLGRSSTDDVVIDLTDGIASNRGTVPGVTSVGWPATSRGRVQVGTVGIDLVDGDDVVDLVRSGWDTGRGGSIVTVNVDIARMASRDPEVQRLVNDSTLSVADGAPIVWASQIQGTPVPCRVAGSDLVHSLTAAAAECHGSVFLIGGPAGIPDQAASVFEDTLPGISIAGAVCPPFGFDEDETQIEVLVAQVAAARPDLVLVGLGFPKQERLIRRLQLEHPNAWYLGCGGGLAMAAGHVSRAPVAMQQVGLEWVYRLALEPRRLAGRYLGHDLPYAASLLRQSRRARRLDPRPFTGMPDAEAVLAGR